MIKILSISEEKSGEMNVSAAWDFVDSMLGVDYGYEVSIIIIRSTVIMGTIVRRLSIVLSSVLY